MALSREQLLGQLQEEGAEVIKATAKIKRFGWRRCYPGYGVNSERLAEEMGQLQAVVDEILRDHMTAAEREIFVRARDAHLAKVEAANREAGEAEDIEGLRTGDLVNEVEVDVEQVGRTIFTRGDQVVVPYLFGQS